MQPTKARTAEGPAPESTPVSLFSEWIQQGTNVFFASQRIMLDMVMRQNAIAMNAIRDRVTAMRAAPFAEAAGEALVNFIAAQKILLDLAKRQNDIVLKGVKERAGAATPGAAMTDLLRRSVDTFIDLQRHFLDLADEQTGAWIHAAKSGKAFSGKGLAELARDGMETFVETQKKFLNLVAEETAKASKGANGAAKPVKVTELSELARESVDAFIDAQRGLLETAGRQMHVSLSAAGRSMDLFSPLPGTTLAELTRQGVESFVAAQKSLLEVLTRSTTPVAHPKPASHENGRRAARKARAK